MIQLSALISRGGKAVLWCGILGATAALPAQQVLGVHPQHWDYNTEATYATGTFDGTVVNNYGQLTLGHPVAALLPKGKFAFVNTMARGAHGTLYFGTAPHGAVYELTGGHAKAIYTPKGGASQILSLASDAAGDLLAGVNIGGKGELVRLTRQAGGGFASKIIFSKPAVRYIWSILPRKSGAIYLGTGPDGALWRLDAKGASAVLHTGENNVMALLGVGGDVVLATDGSGLVLRYDAKTKKALVLLAADNAEVDALAKDKQGDIFAATASPVLAAGGGAAFKPQGQANGRPVAVLDDSVVGNANGRAGKQGGGKPNHGKPGKGKPAAKNVAAQMLAKGPRPLPFPHTGNVTSNAVYQIAPSGRTSVLLHVPDMVLSMVYTHHRLVLGLSGHGRVISYNPITQSRSMVVFSQTCRDIMCEAADGKGDMYFGTANAGQVFKMSPGFAASGTYTSKVLEAGLPAVWGAAHLAATVPAGDTVFIRTRSGNVKDVARLARFWSRWSSPIPANSYRAISSPAGRYLQFRLMLTQGKGSPSAQVDAVRINYQQINVAPRVDSIMAKKVPGKPQYTIKWAASDANGDKLTYHLEYRQQGMPIWIHIAAKPDNSPFVWDTSGIPAGRYRVKIVADDSTDNTVQTALRAARETRYLHVSNAAPAIAQVKAKVQPSGRVLVSGVASGSGSPIAAVAIQVDSSQNWQPAAASDKMFDSPLEGFSALTKRLKPGPHRIVIRAVDSQGNRGFASILATVK